MATASSLAVFGCAAALALCHLLAGHLRFLHAVPRSRWLSAAGGASVAYVFLHLLPEIAEAERGEPEQRGGLLDFERSLWLVAMSGLVAFYGLERLARTRGGHRGGASERSGRKAVFKLHVGSFAVYDFLVGYLLQRQADQGSLAGFTLAMGLHFLVVDRGLEELHRDAYRRVGRWILVAALLGGWAAGLVGGLTEIALSAMTAFLGGGIVLNVLKEELPDERQSRFVAFLWGAGAYGALLLAI